jgi:hypothetical protein
LRRPLQRRPKLGRRQSQRACEPAPLGQNAKPLRRLCWRTVCHASGLAGGSVCRPAGPANLAENAASQFNEDAVRPTASWPGFVPAIHVLLADMRQRRGCPARSRHDGVRSDLFIAQVIAGLSCGGGVALTSCCSRNGYYQDHLQKEIT